MAPRVDKVTLSWVRYDESLRWSIHGMSGHRFFGDRFSINMGHWSLIVELWFLRTGSHRQKGGRGLRSS